MEATYKIILFIHVVFGFTSLSTGLVPMFANKGGKVHNFWGNVYFWAMFGVFITTIGLFAIKPTELKLQFFLNIAILSFYQTFTGRRALLMKKSATQATMFDKVVSYIGFLCGVTMISYAVYTFTKGYTDLSILFAVFGTGVGITAFKDIKLFNGLVESEKMHWFFHHIARMMSSYTASVTAFMVNMTRFLPKDAPTWMQLAPWFIPGLILGVGSAYMANRHREKMKLGIKYGFITKQIRKLLVKEPMGV